MMKHWDGLDRMFATKPRLTRSRISSPRPVWTTIAGISVETLRVHCLHWGGSGEVIEEHLLGHHMYADDAQLIAHLTINDIPSFAPELHRSHPGLVQFEEASAESNKERTDLVWIPDESEKIFDLNLYIGPDIIKPVKLVRDLGVYLDSELSMEHHISTVICVCVFHHRHKSIHRILGANVTLGLVSVFVTTRMECIWCTSAVLLPTYLTWYGNDNHRSVWLRKAWICDRFSIGIFVI